MSLGKGYFAYTARTWDAATCTATFSYETTTADGMLAFSETVRFPTEGSRALDPALFDRLLNALHLMLGISYYKLFCPGEIRVSYQLLPDEAAFWTTVYRKGLGEFAYRNGIDLRGIHFPSTDDGKKLAPVDVPVFESALVGIGGGKDSIVALELLRDEGIPAEGFVVETYTTHDIAQRVCDIAGIPLAHIVRTLDAQALSPISGSYKGHIPISAVYAFLGYTWALMSGKQFVVTGNEWSSNFGNALHHGEEVNHQWSKSMEFETLFTEYTSTYLSPSVRYCSILRPFHEIRIAEMFSHYENYFPVFTSCNRKFRIDPAGRPGGMWCGECPKCAFVFLMLAPHIPKEKLIALYGKNLLDDPGLVPLFADVLGFGSIKPFDCVGTFDEAQAALFLVRDTYPSSVVVKEFLPRIQYGEELVRSVMHVARASSVPQRVRFAGMKSALLLGYGKEGKTSETFVRAQYPAISVAHADAAEDPDYLARQTEMDIVVKTAGLPKEKVSAHYTTATNIFFSRWRGKTVGITGSKGKSTTASLVAAMLREGGMDARLVGNIGVPMLTLLEEPHDADTIAVIELSSYQLDDCEFSPDVAVVTALFPEHMDYHGSEDAYFAAKRRIVTFQKSSAVFVFDPIVPRAAAWAAEARSRTVPFVELPFSQDAIMLPGAHNVRNVRAAATVAQLLGVSDDAIERVVRGFSGLRHRLQFVTESKGIRFYDDAISTTPESTLAALAAIPDVDTLFLGGRDRGYDFSELERTVRSLGIRNLVLFPDSGTKLFADRSGFSVLETDSMRDAVAFAYAHTGAGKACLLSCASPSYSIWRDFEEKGDAFQSEVYNQSV